MVLLNSENLEFGTPLISFELKNIDEDTFSSDSFTKDTVVIAFICNHCPYVIEIIEDFSKLALKLKDRVDFVTISANDPAYRNEDSFENMKLFHEKYNFSFPYLFDESQEIAKKYQAVCTPDIYTYKKIDGEYKLAYHGAFEYLEESILKLEAGETQVQEGKPSIGCSIKWK